MNIILTVNEGTKWMYMSFLIPKRYNFVRIDNKTNIYPFSIRLANLNKHIALISDGIWLNEIKSM